MVQIPYCASWRVMNTSLRCALPRRIALRGRPPPKQAPELLLAHHSFQFLERQERNESGKYHDTLGKQFIPTFAGDLGKTFRQALAVDQCAERVFQDAEHPHQRAEHHGPVKSGTSNGVRSSPHPKRIMSPTMIPSPGRLLRSAARSSSRTGWLTPPRSDADTR